MRASRRAKRAAARAQKGGRGPCQHPDCPRKARNTSHCVTCEALKAAGKRSDVVSVSFCLAHAEWGTTKIRRHALVKHPANLVRAGIASLKGEL